MFKLPDLGYAYDALEPHIDARTMEIHHSKHHAAYTNNLNTALEKYPDLQSKSAEDLIRNLNAIPEDIRAAVRNNGGGYVNHNFFWEIMAPGGAKAPGGAVAKAIDSAFGSFDKLKEAVNKAGTTRFGSGPRAFGSAPGTGGTYALVPQVARVEPSAERTGVTVWV